MTQKIKIVHGVGITVLLIVGFYAGMSYEKSRVTSAPNQPGSGRQMRAGGGRGGFGRLVTGDVIAQDANSITVKLTDGGSKIVFFSASTTVAKSTLGSMSDVAIGTLVMVNGQTNPDGSVTAQNIQIRPAGQMRTR